MTDLLESRFTFVDGIAVARLEGRMTAQQAIHWIGETLAWARLRHFPLVMLTTTGASGFAVPSLALRVEMVREWASAAGGLVTVAIVCPPEFIDPEKFAMTVAAGFGLRSNVFAEQGPAMDWLRGLD